MGHGAGAAVPGIPLPGAGAAVPVPPNAKLLHGAGAAVPGIPLPGAGAAVPGIPVQPFASCVVSHAASHMQAVTRAVHTQAPVLCSPAASASCVVSHAASHMQAVTRA